MRILYCLLLPNDIKSIQWVIKIFYYPIFIIFDLIFTDVWIYGVLVKYLKITTYFFFLKKKVNSWTNKVSGLVPSDIDFWNEDSSRRFGWGVYQKYDEDLSFMFDKCLHNL